MASEDFDPGSVPRDFRLPDGSELTSHLRHTGRAPEREILAELYDVCGGEDWRRQDGWIDPDKRTGVRNAWRNQWMACWSGLGLDEAGNVAELHLRMNGLRGCVADSKVRKLARSNCMREEAPKATTARRKALFRLYHLVRSNGGFPQDSSHSIAPPCLSLLTNPGVRVSRAQSSRSIRQRSP